MSMKQKSKKSIVSIFIVIGILVIITALSVSYRFSNKTSFNLGNVSGNLSGNLYNNGLFCEYNGKIYFSNSYDEGNLYVMNSDGSNISKLYNDTISYINVAGKYIYYSRNNLNEDNLNAVFRANMFGVYRLNTNGKNLVILNNETSNTVSLGNNKIFYQHYDPDTALSLRSISIDGTNEKNLTRDSINPACIVDGTMYYSNVTVNYNLMSMDIESGSTALVYEGTSMNPIYDDNYVYFMDIENDYSLSRVNLSSLEKQDLGTGRVDAYNLYGNYIFFQKNDATNPSLCRMKLDGSEVETILSGNFSNINITSEYVYFNQFGFDTPIYKVSTSGDIDVTRFDEALDAIKN
jgi:Domain of unknown function (DUF5050)